MAKSWRKAAVFGNAFYHNKAKIAPTWRDLGAILAQSWRNLGKIITAMTEQYLPCNINFTCGAGGASPQWLPPFFTSLPGGQNGIQNDGAVGTEGESIILGSGGLGADATGFIFLFSESDDFTLEVGNPISLPSQTVPANASAEATIDAINVISPTCKRLDVTVSFAGDEPGNNEGYFVPVYASNGAPAADSSHREFVGYIIVFGPQAYLKSIVDHKKTSGSSSLSEGTHLPSPRGEPYP